MSSLKRRPRLTEKEVSDIRELCASGTPQQEVAQLAGCGVSTVSKIVNGRYYSGQHKPRGKAPERSKCPHCGGRLEASGKILFCYSCGADLRSEGVKLVPELEKVLSTISSVYPVHMRDHAVATLNRAIDILKEAD